MGQVFRAKIVNLPGYGELVTKHKNGWTRDKYRFELGPHVIIIKQRKSALGLSGSKGRGRQIDSSFVTATKITSLNEGKILIDDLCWLLSFATQSHVAAYEFSFGKRRSFYPVSGLYNHWRPPFSSGIGKISDFVSQTWPRYQTLKQQRPISAFIHMINDSDIGNGLLESRIAQSMQCLESVKSYFALAEGNHHNIREDKTGKFIDSNGKDISFERLLKLTLQEVGMPLPSSFGQIKKLRNALMHRGFIRETDNVTRYIFGPLSAGAMHTAMFEIMEETQDVLREYLLRLLGYKGNYFTYSNRGTHKTVD